MGRNTLKGTFKVSSYIIAFILMVAIHVAMDKIGSNTSSPASREKVGGSPTITDDNLAKADLLRSDSLRDIGNKIEKVLLRNRD